MEYGKPSEDIDLKDFVLDKISDKNRKVLDEAIKKAVIAVEEIIENGIDIAMNKFN